jgi:hypothetical protein
MSRPAQRLMSRSMRALLVGCSLALGLVELVALQRSRFYAWRVRA